MPWWQITLLTALGLSLIHIYSPAWTNPLAAEGETKYNWPSGNFNSQEILLRNGGLTIMGSGAGKLNGVWDKTLRGGKGGVKVTYGSGESAVTKESVEEYYYMRMMALKGLYKAANSKLVSNGVNTSAVIDQKIEMTQAAACLLYTSVIVFTPLIRQKILP